MKYTKLLIPCLSTIILLTGCNTNNDESVPHSIKVTDNPLVEVSFKDLEDNKALKDTVINFEITLNDEELCIEEINITYFEKDVLHIIEPQLNENIYSFVMPDSDVFISVNTFYKAYRVTYKSSDDYSVTLNKENAKKGEEVVFEVNLTNEDLFIEEVSIKYDDQKNSLEAEEGKYQFVMPNFDTEIVIVTSVKTYTVDFASNEQVTYSLSSEKTSFERGENVSFSLVVASGYVLDSVSIKDSSENYITYTVDNGVYTFAMPNSNVTVNAEVSKLYTVTIINNEMVYYSIAGTKNTFKEGEEVIFSASSKYGYVLNSISIKDEEGNDVEYRGSSSYFFNMPASNVVISFEAEQLYRVNVAKDDNCTVTINNEKDYYKKGSVISFVVECSATFEIDTLTVTCGSENITYSLTENVYSFEMPQGNVTITVTTKKNQTNIDSDPFKEQTTFEGDWIYYDGYTDYTMRSRVVFNGDHTLSWYLTYDYDDYDDYYYWAFKPKAVPSDMEGDLKHESENVEYAYDSTSDTITFTTKVKSSDKTITIKINRNSDNIVSIYFTEDASGDYYQTKDKILYKK